MAPYARRHPWSVDVEPSALPERAHEGLCDLQLRLAADGRWVVVVMGRWGCGSAAQPAAAASVAASSSSDGIAAVVCDQHGGSFCFSLCYEVLKGRARALLLHLEQRK